MTGNKRVLTGVVGRVLPRVNAQGYDCTGMLKDEKQTVDLLTRGSEAAKPKSYQSDGGGRAIRRTRYMYVHAHVLSFLCYMYTKVYADSRRRCKFQILNTANENAWLVVVMDPRTDGC